MSYDVNGLMSLILLKYLKIHEYFGFARKYDNFKKISKKRTTKENAESTNITQKNRKNYETPAKSKKKTT